MQLVQEQCEQDISSFFAQAPEGGSTEERLTAVMDFVLQNCRYYHQQLLLWVDFYQQTKNGNEEESLFLRQVWTRTRDLLQDYVDISDQAVIDFIMVFIDGLILQYIYDRGVQDTDWFRQQGQLLIQMVLQHELAIA